MIKNRTKFVLIAGIGLSLFSGLSHTAFEREDDTALVITNPSAPARLGAIALIHDDKGFSVLNKSEIRRIPNHLVSPPLRRISQSEVKARLENNINFRVQQGSDGEFSVQEGGGLGGGGMALAVALYKGVKVAGYTGLGVAIGVASNSATPGGYQERPQEVLAKSVVLTSAAAASGAPAAIESVAIIVAAAGFLSTPFP